MVCREHHLHPIASVAVEVGGILELKVKASWNKMNDYLQERNHPGTTQIALNGVKRSWASVQHDDQRWHDNATVPGILEKVERQPT